MTSPNPNLKRPQRQSTFLLGDHYALGMKDLIGGKRSGLLRRCRGNDRVPLSGVNRLSRNDLDSVSLSRSDRECHGRVVGLDFGLSVNESHRFF